MDSVQIPIAGNITPAIRRQACYAQFDLTVHPRNQFNAITPAEYPPLTNKTVFFKLPVQLNAATGLHELSPLLGQVQDIHNVLFVLQILQQLGTPRNSDFSTPPPVASSPPFANG